MFFRHAEIWNLFTAVFEYKISTETKGLSLLYFLRSGFGILLIVRSVESHDWVFRSCGRSDFYLDFFLLKFFGLIEGYRGLTPGKGFDANYFSVVVC